MSPVSVADTGHPVRWRSVWRRFARRRGGRLGLLIVGGLVLIALTADFIASDKPIVVRFAGEVYLLPNLTDPVALRAYTNQSLARALGPEDWVVFPLVPWGVGEQDKTDTPLAPPSRRHLMGTDTARRDVLARLVHGARVSIMVGLLSVALYVVIGTILGLLAGFWGGWVDGIISRVIETVMTIPVFFLILAIMGVVERAGIGMMMVVMGLVYWTRVARLVRAETLRLRELAFVEAATALGFSPARIMFRHIFPNAMGPVLVTATFGVGAAVLVEASLSFLGFGTPDTMASWGGLLRGAMGNFHAWWLVVFPGVTIFLTVLGYNLTGEALRDDLDPRLRHEA